MKLKSWHDKIIFSLISFTIDCFVSYSLLFRLCYCWRHSKQPNWYHQYQNINHVDLRDVSLYGRLFWDWNLSKITWKSKLAAKKKNAIWNACWSVKPWGNAHNYRSHLTYNWIIAKKYTIFEDFRSTALEDGKVEGALPDTYVAAEHKHELFNDKIFIKEILDRPFGYRVVLSGAAVNMEQRCRNYISMQINKISISSTTQQRRLMEVTHFLKKSAFVLAHGVLQWLWRSFLGG